MPRSSSIRKRERAKGAVYEARYRDTDGRLRGRTFAREKDAKAFLTTVREQVQSGDYTDPGLKKTRYEVVAARWLATRTKVRPTTAADCRRTLAKHVLPRSGGQGRSAA